MNTTTLGIIAIIAIIAIIMRDNRQLEPFASYKYGDLLRPEHYDTIATCQTACLVGFHAGCFTTCDFTLAFKWDASALKYIDKNGVPIYGNYRYLPAR